VGWGMGGSRALIPGMLWYGFKRIKWIVRSEILITRGIRFLFCTRREEISSHWSSRFNSSRAHSVDLSSRSFKGINEIGTARF
jgi:hypothetical protein